MHFNLDRAFYRQTSLRKSGWARGRAVVLVFLAILLLFGLLESSLPIASAIKIGVDEDFELAKSILSIRGYKFYTEVWNDQPPLYVFLLSALVRHGGPGVLLPRLLTVVSSVILITSLYLLTLRLCGILAAALAASMIIASPGFLDLSCSCTQECAGQINSSRVFGRVLPFFFSSFVSIMPSISDFLTNCCADLQGFTCSPGHNSVGVEALRDGGYPA